MTPKITPTTVKKPYHPQWWYEKLIVNTQTSST
jgi:hypothetical protein